MATVTAGERRKLVINPSTREIIVPKSERVFGTYKENGVERKFFLCPKVIGNNVDLMECFVFINYISTGGNYGQILCTDVEIDPENDACVTFSWELTSNVFDENRDATIYFSVQAKQIVNENLEPVFSTRTTQGKAYANIDATPNVQEKNADVIVQILKKLTELENSTMSQEELKKAFEQYFKDNPIAKSIPTDESLGVTEDGKLFVKTTNEVIKDNTLPISSGAVYMQIGNINALLETI